MKRAHHFLAILLMVSSLQINAQSAYLLDDRKDRINYLEAIYRTDQAIRYYEDSVMLASGWRSEAHLLAIDSLHRIDSSLTLKIDNYLNTYGYPEKEYYGEIASMTPWLILKHSPIHSIRNKHFDTLYRAYNDKNLKQRRLIEFLELEYQHRFNKDFNSYNREEARIKELIRELELRKI